MYIYTYIYTHIHTVLEPQTDRKSWPLHSQTPSLLYVCIKVAVCISVSGYAHSPKGATCTWCPQWTPNPVGWRHRTSLWISSNFHFKCIFLRKFCYVLSPGYWPGCQASYFLVLALPLPSNEALGMRIGCLLLGKYIIIKDLFSFYFYEFTVIFLLLWIYSHVVRF